MTGYGWNGLKFLEMAGIILNGFEWLEMAGMAGMAGNSRNQFEIALNGWI